MLRRSPIIVVLIFTVLLCRLERLLFGHHASPSSSPTLHATAIPPPHKPMVATACHFTLPPKAKFLEKGISPCVEINGFRVHVALCVGPPNARDYLVEKQAGDWHPLPEKLWRRLGWAGGKDMLSEDSQGAFYEQIFWRSDDMVVIVADIPAKSTPEQVKKLLPAFGEIASTIHRDI